MTDTKLNGLQKAAVLLKSLPPAVVEKALTHLGGKQATLIRTELDNVSKRADLAEIEKVFPADAVAGTRYPEKMMALLDTRK